MERTNWENIFNDLLLGNIQKRYCQSFKNLLIKYKTLGNKCIICNINSWNNKKIVLEIDHIDGNNWNNKKENLRLLCPNCHSQTKNWKKKKNYKKGIIYNKKESIIQKFKDGESINNILINLNLNTGGNYKIIKKLLKENNININLNKQIKLKKEVDSLKKSLIPLQHKIDSILNSNIEFHQKGWTNKVGEILNMTPQGARNWVKREIPNLYKNICFKHKN